MAEMTPAAEAIAGLLAGGWTYAEIGRSLGINGSSIRQAIRTISDATKSGWVTGKLPDGWTAATLVSRIAQPQQGDSWKPGDVSGALITLVKEQNEGVVSAVVLQESVKNP